MITLRDARWLLIPAVLLALAAAPAPVEDVVREANTAYARGKYAAAVRLYEQAEARAEDPSLVAFNKAAALYQLALAATAGERLGHFRDAELHYRCAAEGADEPRLLRARFGLANSLVQGRPDSIAALAEAITLYRACLATPGVDEGTANDGRHNLEVAKVMLARAKVKAKEDPNRENGEDKKKPDDQKKPDPNKPGGGEDEGKKDGSPKPTDKEVEAKDREKANPTDQRAPGQGNMKTSLDASDVPPLSVDEAEEELREAAKRIADQRAIRRHRPARTLAGTVKDW